MEEINWQKHLYLWIKNKGYAENTWTSYRDTMNQILYKFPKLETTTLLEIQEYTASIKNDNTRKNTCVIIRWAFNTVLHKPIDWRDLPYPKRKRKIQPIYSHEEAMKIFNSVKHKKQKAILGLIIDKGLRISEPLKIKITDCTSKEGKIVLRDAKTGGRIIYPSEFVWKLIKDYWNELKVKPITFVFEGDKEGMPYTEGSIRGFVERHCKITGVEYKGMHSFRRMVGTWMVQNKVPETVVAETLGNSVRTLHKSYLIHSPDYLRSISSPLSATA